MKRIKTYWKRFLIWIGAVAFAACSVACAKPADGGKRPYVSMETMQMLETAQEPALETADAMRERLGAPTRYVSEPITAVDGRLEIRFDAAVDVPRADAMPICRVEAGEFDEVFVNRAFTCFCADTPMYDRANLQNTREDIQKWIDVLKSDLENDYFPDGDENIEYWREIYTKELAAYEKRLAFAADDLGAPVSSAILNVLDLENGGVRETLHLVDTPNPPENMSFSVNNNIRYPFNEARWFDDAGGGVTAAPRSNAEIGFMDNMGRERGERWRFVRNIGFDESAAELALSPKDAAAKVEATLSSLGLSDTLYPAEAMVLTRGDSGECAYSIDMRRKVNGIDVLSPSYASYVGSPMDGFEWHYESATAYVDEGGVFHFRWKAPLRVLETVVESAALMPFEEIIGIARNMLPVVLAQDAYYWDYYARMRVDITEISLSFQRISDQNSVTSGLLIPAWNFWGATSSYFADGTADTRDGDNLDERAVQGRSLLSLNAIDGSVINNEKGY